MNYYDSDFEEKLGNLNMEDPILVYCKARGRSASVMDMLKKRGFNEVYNLTVGFDGWLEAGIPVEQ